MPKKTKKARSRHKEELTPMQRADRGLPEPEVSGNLKHGKNYHRRRQTQQDRDNAAGIVRLPGGGIRREISRIDRQIPSPTSVSSGASNSSAGSVASSVLSERGNKKPKWWLRLFCCSGTDLVVEPKAKITDVPEAIQRTASAQSAAVHDSPRDEISLSEIVTHPAVKPVRRRAKKPEHGMRVVDLELEHEKNYRRDLVARHPGVFNDEGLDGCFEGGSDSETQSDKEGEVDGPSMLSVN